MDTEKHVDEREVLFELYSFKASNGKAYYVRPAALSEVMSPNSGFIAKFEKIGVPDLNDRSAARLHCLDVMSDPERKAVLAELVEKYVVCGDVSVTLTQLSEDGFTVDDMILLIKKLAGISG